MFCLAITYNSFSYLEPKEGYNMQQAMVSKEQAIRAIVASSVINFAQTFSHRHIQEFNDPDGTINMKIHNVFIAALGSEIQYYTALVRSLDSSLGNMLEAMALAIARFSYTVTKSVDGYLYPEQVHKISEILEGYKNKQNPLTPLIQHYDWIAEANSKYIDITDEERLTFTKTHVSDYYFHDPLSDHHFIVELKIGGDLDNKKARSEKEAIFEQYAILRNILGNDAKISCYFATAYNRFGEGKPWEQGRVLQFFAREELLIGKDFWDFVCKSDQGYDIVIDEYRKNAHYITQALDSIKEQYLG
jgi:hypothetical protein